MFGLKPLFKGANTLDQLVQIILHLLGTPSAHQVAAMKANFKTRSLPSIESTPLAQVVPSAPAEALDLCARLLCYDPQQRLSAEDALSHRFFDELRDIDHISLPYGKSVITSSPSPRLLACCSLFDRVSRFSTQRGEREAENADQQSPWTRRRTDERTMTRDMRIVFFVFACCKDCVLSRRQTTKRRMKENEKKEGSTVQRGQRGKRGKERSLKEFEGDVR